MEALIDSNMVMKLLNIKSATTLIKYERLGFIKITMRLGNRKRYSLREIKKLLDN